MITDEQIDELDKEIQKWVKKHPNFLTEIKKDEIIYDK